MRPALGTFCLWMFAKLKPLHLSFVDFYGFVIVNLNRVNDFEAMLLNFGWVRENMLCWRICAVCWYNVEHVFRMAGSEVCMQQTWRSISTMLRNWELICRMSGHQAQYKVVLTNLAKLASSLEKISASGTCLPDGGHAWYLEDLALNLGGRSLFRYVWW